jgi:hypothetical protein
MAGDLYAIVLTFDEQIGFAELVYKKYMKLWPGCPFIFRIPYNSKKDNKSYGFFKPKSNVGLIKSESDIRSTMEALLQSIPDNQWIYWCIDDRFPISINVSSIQSIYDNLPKGTSLNQVKLLRWREPLLNKKTNIGNLKFFKQVDGCFWGFWHHSFMKAGVLKKVFLSKPKIKTPKHVNRYLMKGGGSVHLSNILVPERNIVTFGEPCIHSRLTRNGLIELKANDCPIPPYASARLYKQFTDHKISPLVPPGSEKP